MAGSARGPVSLGAPLPAPVESTTPDLYETPGLAAATAAGGSSDAVARLIAGRLSHGLATAWLDALLKQTGCRSITETRLGFVPADEVPSYYRAAALVVLPYESISESGVLRFAHSTGAVPVCSDLPEFRTTITDGVNGFLFRSGDAAHCAAVLARALSALPDPCIDRAIAETDQRYAWPECARQTLALYDELTGIAQP